MAAVIVMAPGDTTGRALMAPWANYTDRNACLQLLWSRAQTMYVWLLLGRFQGGEGINIKR